MDTTKLVEIYLKDRSRVWAISTLKSSGSRLRALGSDIDREPAELLDVLKQRGRALYTIKTTFICICKFYDWLVYTKRADRNPYREFLDNEGRYIFRAAYSNVTVSIDFDEALALIKERVPSAEGREWGEFLLKTGLRLSERHTIKKDDQGNAFVTGKGGFHRRLLTDKIPSSEITDKKLRIELKKAGLKPHDLRKLFATRLLRSGLDIHDVASATGHRNINTLIRYLQPHQDSELQKRVQQALN